MLLTKQTNHCHGNREIHFQVCRTPHTNVEMQLCLLHTLYRSSMTSSLNSLMFVHMFELHLCHLKSRCRLTTFSSWSNWMQKPQSPQCSQCCPDRRCTNQSARKTRILPERWEKAEPRAGSFPNEEKKNPTGVPIRRWHLCANAHTHTQTSQHECDL